MSTTNKEYDQKLMNFDNIVKTDQDRQSQLQPPTEEEKEEIHKTGGMFEYQPRNIHTSQNNDRMGDRNEMEDTI